MTTLTDVEVREGTYGDKVIAVEPGGAEFIPLSERHGRPLQLFWTWTSPNMEFATIFVGFLGVCGLGPELLVHRARDRARHRARRHHPGHPVHPGAALRRARRWC